MSIASILSRTGLAAMGLVVAGWCHASCPPVSEESSPPQRVTPFSEATSEALGTLVRTLIGGVAVDLRKVPTDLTRCAETAIYVDVRKEGIPAYRAWGTGQSPAEALQAAFVDFRATPPSDAPPDAAVISVAFNYRPARTQQDFGALTNANRGLLGVEVHTKSSGIRRVAPTEMIAQNISFERALRGISRDDVVRVRFFDTDQIHIALEGRARVTRLFRGEPLVTVQSVDRRRVRELQRLLQHWLFNNLDASGRMTYKFRPSPGRESSGNNMIRQWMATNTMTHAARVSDNDALMERVERNIRYNLEHFYSRDADGKGIILEQQKVKLGAVALAALSLIEHPARAEFQAEERSLRATVDSLWRETGEFRTFFRPPYRNDNQNFYPGEALLLWATLYEESVASGAPDEQLLERIMRSFAYYRAWHLQSRNPAFVPWHTQAYYRVWRITKDVALSEFIFTMNDWLIDTMQQWDEATPYPDTLGRFYTSSASYGPPHASSTGVYLEGLADAWQLAMDTGDKPRAEKYRRAIVRGLRSVIQLTFENDVDMFYSAHRERLVGGVKTTVYDNEVRVDNVQHNLRAVLKIVERFRGDDYRP